MLINFASVILFFLFVDIYAEDVVDNEKSANLRATAIKRPSFRPTRRPTRRPSSRRPSFSPTTKAVATYFGHFYYTDANTCKAVSSFTLKPLSVCQPITGATSNDITDYMKYTCGTNSASAVYYDASDSTCSTPKNSSPLTDYGMCPSTTTSSKSLCLSTTDISNLVKSVKGIVYTQYSSKSACKAQTSSAVTQIFYYKTSFEIDGVSLYECKADDKKGGSFAYVCNGSGGIQQLKYSTTNCKGKSTQFRKATFQQLDSVCVGSSSATPVFQYPVCSGPSNMN